MDRRYGQAAVSSALRPKPNVTVSQIVRLAITSWATVVAPGPCREANLVSRSDVGSRAILESYRISALRFRSEAARIPVRLREFLDALERMATGVASSMLAERYNACRALCLPLWRMVCAVVVIGGSAVARADDPAIALEAALIKVIEQSEPAVVSIAKIRRGPFETRMLPIRPMERERAFLQSEGPPLDPENPDFQPNSFGVGVIVAGMRPNERFVLTNYHVVQGGPRLSSTSIDDATTLFVRFSDRRSCYASIFSADPRSDLAVLHLDLADVKVDAGELKPLDWTAATPIRKGQLVVMLGNPYALAHDGSVSAGWGMIANLTRRPLPWTDDRMSRTMMYRLGNLIQIDGRLNLGTSGGPLLNLKGELIGLTTSLAAIEGYEKSAGFAIPLDDLTRRIVKSLIQGHEVEYGMLGVEPQSITPAEFRSYNTGLKQASAARVRHMAINSPAARAGIHVDDIILSVDDVPIYSDFDLMRVVGLHPPEDKVDIAIWRKDRGKITIETVLGKWPVFDDEGIIESTPRYAPWRGISVDYPTGRKKYHRDDDPYRRAVVVTKVATDSVAESAGVQAGLFIAEVNRIPVQTPREFAEATKATRGPVELRLYEGGKITVPDDPR